MKIEMKKIVLVLFVLCAFEAHAQSLGGEIVRKKEKPTLRSAWSSTFADTHTKVVYKRVDKHLKWIMKFSKLQELNQKCFLRLMRNGWTL